MWILHQSKETIFNIDNAIAIEYGYRSPHRSKSKKEHTVIYCDDGEILSIDIIMGIYPSKERCLEVIQDIIKNIHLKNPTYEMPEK